VRDEISEKRKGTNVYNSLNFWVNRAIWLRDYFRAPVATGETAQRPFAYAYRYPDAVRYNAGGMEINGNKPTEVIPLYLAVQPAGTPHASGVAPQPDLAAFDEVVAWLEGLDADIQADKLRPYRAALAAAEQEGT
jgi:hypothetical protein